MPSPFRRTLDRAAGRPWVTFAVLFVLSCSVQGFFLTKVPKRWIEPHTRWESQAIAVSLAQTGRFADPYLLPTGPTAHLPPIPPAIVGLIYRVLGLTLTAGYVAWWTSIVFEAAVWALLPWLAPRVGLPGGAGVIAGLVGGVIPRWPGHGEGLTALALALLMAAFARRWYSGGGTAAGSLALGVAAGLSFHVQPALFPVVLGWMGAELWLVPQRRKFPRLALVASGIVLACLPWGLRNLRTFDAVFFIRSNFGLELRMGNHQGSTAAMDVMDRLKEHRHPRTHEAEARKVQQMGEVVYMRDAGREAMEWIASHPGEFARLTGSRIAHWWLGPLYDPPMAVAVTTLTLLALLGIWKTFPSLERPQRAVLLVPLLAYPVIYYVVAYMPRYRQPLNFVYVLLAASMVSHLTVERRNLSSISFRSRTYAP